MRATVFLRLPVGDEGSYVDYRLNKGYKDTCLLPSFGGYGSFIRPNSQPSGRYFARDIEPNPIARPDQLRTDSMTHDGSNKK